MDTKEKTVPPVELAPDPIQHQQPSDPIVVEEAVGEVVRQDEADLAIDGAVGEVFRGCLKIVTATHRFADIPPGMAIEDPPPEDWMPGVTHKERIRAWRIAHYSLMSGKNAPAALTLAGRSLEVIMRFVDLLGRQNKDLRMSPAVEMPVPKFEEMEVDD